MSASTSTIMFQKSLQDLVKGIRGQKRNDVSEYISQSIAEIKTELKSMDLFVKAEAVRKLTYLQMLGYNVSWASFAIVEVMSQSRFAHKRIGYLAANQSFTESTDVILLTTNLFKKEFERSSISTQYETGLAINSLANIVTHDLARDCMADMVTLMSHNKPYVRKKAVLAMYKLYVKYPPGLRLTFDKLKERLDDPEVSVTSCAVNVICELANKNPKNYLAMAPKFFRLLTTSANNWMLIKVVKLLGSLVSEEPRLARKLLEPLATIIQNTTAKSLQYECINTVTHALPYTKREDGTDAKSVPTVVKLCSDYLRQFIEDPDQNLKYLGLVGLVTLMQSHPKVTVDHRDIVMKCLDDDDVTIRTRALELLAGMVTRKTIIDLVQHLLTHLQRAEGAYRDELISKILYMGSRDKFSFITDFAWYTSVLLDLASMRGTKHGKEVAEQLIEIALRVDTVRPYTVDAMLSMLLNEDLILGPARITVSEVLRAAAWIVGEYSDIVTRIADDDAEDEEDEEADEESTAFWIEGPTGEEIRSKWRSQKLHALVISALLHPRATNLPPHVQACYMQAAMKIFVQGLKDCEEEELVDIVSVIRSRMNVFLQSVDLEVQERASTLRYLLDDLGILTIAWEAQVEEEKKEEDERKKSTKADLLFMPTYTTSSVRAVDENAAKAAKEKAKILSTLTAETFYAVHAKAQRRVPVPEGLDLEAVLNSKALDDLLGLEDPVNLNISQLSFTTTIHIDSKSNQVVDEEEARISQFVKSSFGDYNDRYKLEGNVGTVTGSGATISGSGSSSAFLNIPERPAEDRLFYLGGNGTAASVVSASDTHSKDLNDGSLRKKSKKSKDKKDKKKSKGGEINTHEMLPMGAVDSDDEPARSASKSKKKASVSDDKPVSRRKAKKDQSNLEDVDITVPLRPGEALPVMQHYVAPSAIQTKKKSEVDEEDHAPNDKESKKKKKTEQDVAPKKSGKKTEEKGKKGKKKSDSAVPPPPTIVDDLLSLDWSNPVPPTPPLQQPQQMVMETTNLLPLDMDVGDKKKKSSKSKDKDVVSAGEPSKKKSSSSTSSKVWLPLSSENSIDVYYAVTSDGTSDSSGCHLLIWLRVLNHSTDGSKVSAELHLQSSGTLRALQGNIIRSSPSLAQNAESQTSIGFVSEPSTQPTIIKGTLHCAINSLLGQDVKSFHVSLKIPICVYFTPFKLSEEAFATLLSKNSSKWGSSNAKVAYSSKAKTAIKSVSIFLNASIVESEVSKAASMAAKTSSGASVCCLAKQSKDGFISVDIKVLGTVKGEGQPVADAISAALSELSL